ncbi:DEAD/DEAH box helicase [Leeia sp. IMCC25680]|uniref:DEAD-box ATP-dependent RNA helicase RhpA n=2 Tax=Leeia aquatica TaxID=2725557 RepID=A0A847SFR4_9NEIS|nr:DEAD/DEAH box helicase [Leeia aquatica]
MHFSELGLSEEIMRAIADQGYDAPTPIQAAAIPAVMGGRDLLAAAQTGTGKTAAFTLPMLNRLRPYGNTSPSPARHPLRALILTPTRELADQVFANVQSYSKYLPLRCTVAFGGVAMPPQTTALRNGVEILVATPGRLLDHIQQKNVQLNQVEFLVLDEADRMLDMGFIDDIKRLMGMLPAKRQNLLFSATFSPEIKALADQLLDNPQVVEVARRNATNANVTQLLYKMKEEQRYPLLLKLLKHHDIQQVLIFARTKQTTERLARQLQRDRVSAVSIHGDKTQQARLESLAAFKEGRALVMVATDVAARGLDIDLLPFVINYELPNTPEDYVHRIGRTGRAGALGTAISLSAPDDERSLANIEKLIKQPLSQQDSDSLLAPPPRPVREVVSEGRRERSRDSDGPPELSNWPTTPRRDRTPQIAALFLPPQRVVSPDTGDTA